jgi:hypothetical protein
MYTLIVDCSNFILEHAVHIVDEKGHSAGMLHLTIDDVVKFVSQDSRITNVKLAGQTDYCYGVKENIEKQLATEYAINNVKVEVL